MSTTVDSLSGKPEYEYIHSCYTINKEDEQGDAVFVKRNKFIKDKDGVEKCIPEFVFHKNVERDFWITKKGFVNLNLKK